MMSLVRAQHGEPQKTLENTAFSRVFLCPDQIFTPKYFYVNLCQAYFASFYQSMPAELRSAIKSVDKKTSVGAGSTQTRTDSMKIFLFSETECFGRIHHSAVDEGNQYPIFTDDASRIKTLLGPQIIEWWLRSPRKADAISFGLVHSTGQAGYTRASWEYGGINFGFCV